jgi:transcriptional regulatory protein LEU3
MSVVFDCFWWWRAEFGGQSNPYPDEGESEQITTTANESIIPGFDNDELVSNSIYSGGVFPDWQWAAGISLPIENVMNVGGDEVLSGEDFLLPL